MVPFGYDTNTPATGPAHYDPRGYLKGRSAMSENPETTGTDTGTQTDGPDLPPPVASPPQGGRPASSIGSIVATIAIAIGAFWVLQFLLTTLGLSGGG
jgi:hypothetical protein